MAEDSAHVGGNGSGNGHAPAEAPPDFRALTETLGEIKTLETAILLDRLRWAREHGVTFDGKRKEYEILGYDTVITYKQYRDEYARGGIAGRVVDVMPDSCWRGEPAFEIIEDEDPEKDTPFELAWKALSLKHGVTSKLLRVDKLSRLSTYAVLLIGAPGTLDQELPVVKSPDALLYLKPFSAGGGPGNNSERATIDSGALATVHEYEEDPKSPRFGLPRTYKLKQVAGSVVNLPFVHWSRVVHVAEGLLEDDVFGQPALERVWNLLTDLRKVTGGGAEAFWLRANQIQQWDLDKDMSLGETVEERAAAIAKLKEQAEAVKHQLQRIVQSRGMKINALGSDVANFANPADAIITQIAGSKAIPKRILTGSEMGELASSQDRENFKDQINGRQAQHLGPNVIRQLVDRLIAYGFLPTPQGGPMAYQVRWPHVQVLTEDEKADGAVKWSQTKVGEDPVFVSAEIRDKWYGMAPLTAEQLAEIDARKAEAVKRQQEAMGGGGKDDEEDSPFLRAAGTASTQDDEVVRILAEAIRADASETVLQIIGMRTAEFDPNQPRDENGRWVGMSADNSQFVGDGGPKSGQTRLYRIEPKKFSDNSWLKKHVTPEQWKDIEEQRGKLFSDNLTKAVDYGFGDPEHNAFLVDVPESVAKAAARVHPEGWTEYALPKEYVDRKRPIKLVPVKKGRKS